MHYRRMSGGHSTTFVAGSLLPPYVGSRVELRSLGLGGKHLHSLSHLSRVVQTKIPNQRSLGLALKAHADGQKQRK